MFGNRPYYILMILKDNRDIETKGESNDDFMPPLKDVNDFEYQVYRELLVARRALSVQIKKKMPCQ